MSDDEELDEIGIAEGQAAAAEAAAAAATTPLPFETAQAEQLRSQRARRALELQGRKNYLQM